MTEIHNLRTTMTDGVIQPKILQTQVPLFRGNREKYNELEHLLKNHLRPHMNKLTDEQKLNYFQSLLRDEAIEFWQTLKITTETTLQDVLQAFTKEYAKEDLKEVSKYKFDQMRYDPTKESFADFLTRYKKLAKQAYGDKANDIAETFLFAKLPIQIQNELAMAGKHDAKVEEIKTFVQRRCQYAQLLPGTSDMQPFNQVYNYQSKQNNAQPAPNHNNTEKNATREVKRRFEGNCRYCNILGHKWIECRKRLRDEANGITKKSQQRPQPGNNNAQQQETEKPRYNSKLVCQIMARSEIPHGIAETGYQVHRLTEMYHMTSSPPMKIGNSAVNSNNRRTTTSQPTKSRRRQTNIPKQKTTTATTWITTMNSTRIQKTCNGTSSSTQPNRKCAHQKTNSNSLLLENYNDRMLAAS